MLVAVVAVLLLLSTLGWATTVNTIEERLYRHIDEALDDGLTPLDFHHLFFAFLWQEDLSDWKALEPSLDRLASARSIDPLMADELRHVRSRLAVAEGRPAAALELFRSMGGMSSWWVSGPMPIDELEDFNRVAVQPDPKAEWRPAKGCTPLGWIRLDGVAWPARRQMVFLATTVASDRAQEAALRVGAAQVARLWINGELVLTSPQPLDHAEDQMASGVWLRAGANLIVAAVASENEDWWFRLRITEPDGSPITGVSELDAPPQPVAAQGREAPSVRTIESEIRHDIERGRRNAALALAAYLVHRRPYPVGSGEARAACREARAEDPAEARVLEWLVSSEPSVERQLLEEALAADPELVTARIELASWYARRGLAERAHELLDRVTDPAARAAALDLDAEQWGSLVLPELVTVADTAQSNVEVQLVVARRALDWQRWELARKALSRLEALVPGLETTRMVKEKLAVACGDVDAVKAVLEQRLEVDLERCEDPAGSVGCGRGRGRSSARAAAGRAVALPRQPRHASRAGPGRAWRWQRFPGRRACSAAAREASAGAAGATDASAAWRYRGGQQLASLTRGAVGACRSGRRRDAGGSLARARRGALSSRKPHVAAGPTRFPCHGR
jgi:hypothetical protein